MRQSFLLTVVFILLAVSTAVMAAEMRLANGVIIKGDFIRADDEGLVVKSLKGEKTYAWDTLSRSTRYRYQPKYRANYEAVLDGVAPSAWTAKPIEPLPETTAKPPPTTTGQTPPAKAPEQKLRLEEQVTYENIAPFSNRDFPGISLRAADITTYWGLQYGPGREETVYVAFDTKSPDDVRDVMYAYAPVSQNYRQTVEYKGLKSKRGGHYEAKFKELRLDSRFGKLAVEYKIDFVYTLGQPRDLSCEIETALSADNEKSVFVLYGQPSDLVFGEGVINVRGIIDLPILWLSMRMDGSNPHLVGDLRMSRMKLCPKRGMDNDIQITVYDETGQQVQFKESVQVDESSFSRENVIDLDLSRLERGRKYRANASINLGPFIGLVETEEMFSIP